MEMDECEEEGSWQAPKRTKTVVSTNNIAPAQPNFCTSNRYSALSIQPTQVNDSGTNDNTFRPPPIFIKNVKNFNELRTALTEQIGKNNFSCISKLDYIKIMPTTSEHYRLLVTYFKNNKADFHTYQLKEDKPYRIVIRNLHFTTDPKDIASELEEKGHRVLQVLNALHPVTKAPLPLFFVDIKQAPNNTDIFNIRSILHTVIKIEEPRPRRTIVQCLNCQEYGHTRRYCNHPSRCVKCGGPHVSSTCVKLRETPPKCALCAGQHPANYKGCQVHKNLQLQRNKNQSGESRRRNEIQKTPVATLEQESIRHTEKTYAQAVRSTTRSEDAGTPPIQDTLTSLITSTLQTILQPLLSQFLTQILDKLQNTLLTSLHKP